jgi:hypothetical protein
MSDVYWTSTQPVFLLVCVGTTLHFYLASRLRIRRATPPLPLYAFMACTGTALLPVTWRIWGNGDERPNACQDCRVICQVWNRNFHFTKQNFCSPNSVVSFLWYRFNFRATFLYFSFHDSTTPNDPGPSHCPGFTITLRHTTLGRTPLDEWSARHRDLYLTTRNTHKWHTSTPLARFQATIPASERLQTHTLDRADAGIGLISV